MTSSRAHRQPWPAVAVVVLFLVGLGALILLVPHDPNFREDPAGSITLMCAFAAFDLVGALIIWQRPGNALGWVMATIGLLAAWGASADTYADFAFDADLLYLVSVWVSLWYWYPLLGMAIVFTPLLFPDGRPPSPRWRPVVWVAGLDLALISFLAAFRERIRFSGVSMDNPVGIPGIENPEGSWLGSVLFGLLFLMVLLASASVVVRYVRSGGVRRQQIKWLMFAAVLAVLLTFGVDLAGISLDTEVPFAFSMAAFPVSIAIAIFRYRLYDIDMIINRALVYGALTVSLALVYVGGVAGVQAVFRLLTGQEQQPQLAVVASTLVIAALFNPLRHRVQRIVDRRFYRSKYDARKTLETFTARLRDETNLDDLTGDLAGVVRETMQPEHVSLWLREAPNTGTAVGEGR